MIFIHFKTLPLQILLYNSEYILWIANDGISFAYHYLFPLYYCQLKMLIHAYIFSLISWEMSLFSFNFLIRFLSIQPSFDFEAIVYPMWRDTTLVLL